MWGPSPPAVTALRSTLCTCASLIHLSHRAPANSNPNSCLADTLDKWIKGTGALFSAPPRSFTEIVGDVSASDSEIRFRFNEVLCFNVPLNPKIPLTGEVILTRGDNGLITKYLEIWDTNLADTLKKTYF